MIFIDTGPLLARYLDGDQHHRLAVEAWAKLEVSGDRCVTSTAVLCETATLLGRRATARFAAEAVRSVMSSPRFAVLRPTQEDDWAALDLFVKFSDHEVSFTDALSFALMRRHGVRRAFTFDSDFKYGGFRIWPAR